ncbi:uncharacterized protein ACIB01_015698 [Guaruba guarouba]
MRQAAGPDFLLPPSTHHPGLLRLRPHTGSARDRSIGRPWAGRFHHLRPYSHLPAQKRQRARVARRVAGDGASAGVKGSAWFRQQLPCRTWPSCPGSAARRGWCSGCAEPCRAKGRCFPHSLPQSPALGVEGNLQCRSVPPLHALDASAPACAASSPKPGSSSFADPGSQWCVAFQGLLHPSLASAPQALEETQLPLVRPPLPFPPGEDPGTEPASGTRHGSIIPAISNGQWCWPPPAGAPVHSSPEVGPEWWGQALLLLPARSRAGWQRLRWDRGTLPTGIVPQPRLMNLCASVQRFRPGFILPPSLRRKLLLQPWQSLPSLLIPSLLVPLPPVRLLWSHWGSAEWMGSSPSPNPNCFSFGAHPHPCGIYQLPGAAVLSLLVPFSGSGAEAARARGQPRAAPPARGVLSTPRRASLPGLSPVIVCVWEKFTTTEMVAHEITLYFHI